MKIIVLVSNDLVTDQRVKRTCSLLKEMGHEICVLGRLLPQSMDASLFGFPSRRFKLPWNKGFLFYASLNMTFLWYLLKHRFDLVWANDLDTLLPAVLVSKIKRKKIVYDSHEFYLGVPELKNRKFVAWVWKLIEKFSFKNLSWMITVNDSIARIYRRLYGIETLVIRNVPIRRDNLTPLSRKELGLPTDTFILIIQGRGINIERGVEEAILAMKWVHNALLLIIGDGDVFSYLPDLVKRNNLSDKVRIIPQMPPERLYHYTANADIGLTLDKPLSINYRCSLPNKLFDYIHAGLAVLSSDLYELRKIIYRYDVGLTISAHEPSHIGEKINYMLSDPARLSYWKKNARRAAAELHWDIEKIKLKEKLDEYFTL
ncbi:MAG: glycosyltransferase [Bacteroidales bacterium]|nr:glycosyltransferase [Bacteroidales bacterium]